MSIIQDIREKYAKLTVVVIAVALIGFILTDYFSGRGQSGGRVVNSIGSVNGKKIDANDFARKVTMAENNMKAQGYPAEMASSSAQSQAWEQEIMTLLVQGETDKLGIAVGRKELGDMLYSPTSAVATDLRQQLTDESGNYDPIRALQTINARLKDPQTPQDWKDNFNSYVDQLKKGRLAEKYSSLLVNSVNYPRWFLEKQNADNSQIGNISVVRESYASIPDSAVKIEDKEIANYISKHKDDFKQAESRSISFVRFSAAPTSADSAAIREQLLQLKPEMDSTIDIAAFLARNSANYSDLYLTGNQLGAMKDTVKKMAKNQVIGPYVEGNSYTLLKLIDTKVLPDSVNARHILIATTQRDQSGATTQVRDTTTAYNLADSIRKAIASGSNFDTLAKKLSEDPGSKDSGGVYRNIYYGQMVPTFNDFIFMNPVGSKGIVKTDFGYHYIEILSQKGSSAAYKVAQLPIDIIPSDETVERAMEEATQFAADSRDAKGFDEQFEKEQKAKGRQKSVAVNIGPNDAQINGLGFSRGMVRSIYKAKLGEVLRPEQVNDDFVVAAVTSILSEGTKSPATVRAEGGQLMAHLINKKKAVILKQKVGNVTTLEAAAAALGGKPIEPIDSVRMNSVPKLGNEPKVSGATFNPANKGKVVPEVIAGKYGVYVVRVENVSATPVTTGDINQQRKDLYQQTKGALNPVSVLRKAANIKDKRSEIY